MRFPRDILAIYATVLLAVQKKDVLLMNPIGRLRWKPMRGPRPDGWEVIKNLSLGMPFFISYMRM